MTDDNLYSNDPFPILGSALGKVISGFYGSLFVSPEGVRGDLSEYEIEFEDRSVIKICLAHEGLAIYDSPIFNQEYDFGSYNKVECELSLVGCVLQRALIENQQISRMDGGFYRLHLLVSDT